MSKKMVLAVSALGATAAFAGFEIDRLQQMINEASAKGGGTVVVPPGDWESGPIALKDNVTLRIEKGARLLGDPDWKTYHKAGLMALVCTSNATNVAIEGGGTIDGRGGMMPSEVWRPNLINFTDCRQVRVEGVTLRCGGGWTLHPLRCDGVVIRGIRIWSHVNHCEDGIDIASRNVLVEDCEVDADDDALVFKSLDRDLVVENVEVRNCRLRSSCNAIKFGTESLGRVRNVRIRDIDIGAPSAQGRFDRRRPKQGIVAYLTGLSGIAVECVDGGSLEDVVIGDVRMSGMQTPVFVRLGRRKAAAAGRASCLRNVLIENVVAKAESRIACSITGVPGLRPQNVTVRNISLTVPGGGTAAEAAAVVPEAVDAYPDAHMFDGLPLPAYGFYIRHADGVKLENVTVKTLSPEFRPAVVVDDADVQTDVRDVVRASAPPRLFLVGDSTLQHRTADDRAGSWGEALAGELSEGVEIVNCAIGGRSTKTYMDEWRTNVFNRIHAGDWVLVQFGHNDMSKASDPTVDRQTDPDTEYMNNLLRFVADVKYRSGKPLLVSPITLYLYHKDPKSWSARDPLARWVAAVRRVARESRVPFVDLHELSLAEVRDVGSEVSSKWFMFSVDGSDWAHPTRLGASRIARLFVSHVRATDHPAKALLRSERPTDGAEVVLSAAGEILSTTRAKAGDYAVGRDANGRPKYVFRYEPDGPGLRLKLRLQGLAAETWAVLDSDGWMVAKGKDADFAHGVDLGVRRGGVLTVGKRGGPRQPANWSAWEGMLKQVKSTLDGTSQRCYFWAPLASATNAVPLLVVLHTWSMDWKSVSVYEGALAHVMSSDWAMVAPNYRGANDHPEACGGDAAVQDIVDAVNFAKAATKIDGRRVYIIGGSGGGHMSLQMVGRHPELWAGCASFCPISDLARWHGESLLEHPGRDREYARMLEAACGGTPSERPGEYRRRSPLTWLERARQAGVPVYVVTGIHDGWTGSVPVGQSFRAYNALADERDRIGEQVIAAVESTQKVPDALAYRGPADPFYDPSMRIHFRSTSRNVRLTLFEGGHGGNYGAGLDFLSRQIKGKPADFSLPRKGGGREEMLTR